LSVAIRRRGGGVRLPGPCRVQGLAVCALMPGHGVFGLFADVSTSACCRCRADSF